MSYGFSRWSKDQYVTMKSRSKKDLEERVRNSPMIPVSDIKENKDEYGTKLYYIKMKQKRKDPTEK